MDPRLKLIVKGRPNEILHLLMRLKDPKEIPKHVEVVAKFGDIISCRILRKHLMLVYEDDATRSLKAPQVLPLNIDSEEFEDNYQTARHTTNRFFGENRKKSPVVFGIIDFGFDFTHPDFLDSKGKTRFEKIWVQSLRSRHNNSYGYGEVLNKDQINGALITETPFKTLGYHPGKNDLIGRGMHGTHVLGIAASSGRIGKKGHAGDCSLIAVDMGSNPVNGSDLSLGDSVKLIEGVDFILKQAGDRPCVINLSLGGHGDAHTGQTLVEQAFNNALKAKKGFAIVQSTGNYFQAGFHHTKKLSQGESAEIEWYFRKNDRTANEMEIWYEGEDEIAVGVYDAKGILLGNSEPFQDTILTLGNNQGGIIFHRKNEPNTGKNHINIILAGSPEKGVLYVKINGRKIHDGRYHAYIERDDRGQSRFHVDDTEVLGTIGSICNAPLTITVGAYDQAKASKDPMPFSSAGPTADLRMKPEVVAPGSKIVAARSASRFEKKSIGKLTRKSGSSMASPLVASLVVKVLEKYPEITIYALRRLLFQFCRPYNDEDTVSVHKTGYGAIDESALLQFLNNRKYEIQWDIPSFGR